MNRPASPDASLYLQPREPESRRVDLQPWGLEPAGVGWGGEQASCVVRALCREENAHDQGKSWGNWEIGIPTRQQTEVTPCWALFSVWWL